MSGDNPRFSTSSESSTSEASAWAVAAGGMPIGGVSHHHAVGGNLSPIFCPDSVVLDWNFDTIAIHTITNGRSLSFVSQRVFRLHRERLRALEEPVSAIQAIFRKVETNYNPSLAFTPAFHNGVHAADVVQAFHFFIHDKIADIDPLSFIAAVFAAGMHDYDHIGVNNSFLARTNHDLAVKYCYISILENHHCDSTFSLIDTNIKTLTKEETRRFKQLVRKMILATDLTHHHDMLLSVAQAGSNLHIEEYLCLCLHAADVSNNARPWSAALRWTDRLVEEFFKQGDLEREQCLEVTPMMDRTSCNLARVQLGFIDVVAFPLFTLLGSLVPGNTMSICLEHLERNREIWNESIDT